ncbi:MAG: response regulator [Rhodospirillaceae bacterium]|nr:response regulator [Rhodospirillaceae bacterium]
MGQASDGADQRLTTAPPRERRRFWLILADLVLVGSVVAFALGIDGLGGAGGLSGDDILHTPLDARADAWRAAIWIVVAAFVGVLASGGAVLALLALEVRAARRRVADIDAAESAAAAAERRLADALAGSPAGFALFDADDRLVLCNQRYRELHRESAAVLLPGTSFERILRFGLECGQYPEAAGRETAWTAEQMRRHRTPGTSFALRLTGKRWLQVSERQSGDGGVVRMAVDTTGLKRAEDLLKRTEPAGQVGHFSLDAATGETVFSPNLHRLLGLPPNRPASATLLLDRVAPGDRGGLARALEAARGGSEGAPTLYRSVEIDGSARWFAISFAAERDHQGLPLEIYGTVRDVTALKAAEDEAAEARRDAAAAGSAKSGLLSLLGRGVHGPLDGVMGTLNLLDRAHLRPRDAGTILQVQAHAERLRAALDDARELARLDAGRIALEPGPFDPRLFLREAVSLWRGAAAERGLRIAWSADVMVPEWLIADAGRLRQILDKLVANAIAATDQGSVDIAMAMARRAPAEAVGEPTIAAARRVRLSVQDTGPGIAENDRQRLLTGPIPAAGEDAGVPPQLGLAICRHLCALMGAALDCDSTPGGGTTVFVDVPVEAADTATEAAARARAVPEGASLPKGLRVLVAEDNPACASALRHALARHACIVDLVGDGEAAVDAVEARPYDAVIMDVGLPAMDGLEATRRIRAAREGAPPVIGQAVHPSQEEVERCRAAGMAEVIAKPAPPEALAAALAKAVGDRPQRTLALPEGTAAPVDQPQPTSEDPNANALDEPAAMLVAREAELQAVSAAIPADLPEWLDDRDGAPEGEQAAMEMPVDPASAVPDAVTGAAPDEALSGPSTEPGAGAPEEIIEAALAEPLFDEPAVPYWGAPAGLATEALDEMPLEPGGRLLWAASAEALADLDADAAAAEGAPDVAAPEPETVPEPEPEPVPEPGGADDAGEPMAEAGEAEPDAAPVTATAVEPAPATEDTTPDPDVPAEAEEPAEVPVALLSSAPAAEAEPDPEPEPEPEPAAEPDNEPGVAGECAAEEPEPTALFDAVLYDGTTAEALMAALTPIDYADTVRQFRVDVARGLDALESAFLTHHTSAMERSSHLLSGAAAAMGARALERRARAVNQLCRSGEFLSVTTEMIVMLRAMADRTLAAGPPVWRDGDSDLAAARGVAE